METTAAVATHASESSPGFAATREERGRQIAKLGGIRAMGTRYVVPSQSRNPEVPGYVVDIVDQVCTCPDYELRRLPCKHIEAALFWIAWGGAVNLDDTTDGTTPPKAKRRTYRQNWTAYNAAQTNEQPQVEILLRSLCAGIAQPPRKPGPGRNPIPLCEAIFAAAWKVYTTMSGRRASSEIHERVESAPHYNSVFRALEAETTTPILLQLIEAAAAPLAAIENHAGQIAADSSGFSTVTYDRWFDQKHGKLAAKHPWVKLHIAVGTVTHVVTGVKVSSEGDAPVLPELLAQTARHFNIKEVSADKGYLSKKNVEAIESFNALPFIAFKINSLGTSSPSLAWRRMWAHFTLRADDYLAKYHRRSNVETAFHMIKAKFGSAVRSKLPTAQVNEVLCKVLLHNIVRVVHAVEEFGIETDLLKPAAASVPAAPAALAVVP